MTVFPLLFSQSFTILRFSQAYKFDGVVLEVWSQLGGQGRKALQMLVKLLGEALTKADLKLILVIPPPITNTGKPGMFENDDMKQLYAYVDYFSIMSYDYSSPERPGTLIVRM
jgi:chitinase domain-containing protein 1